MLKIDTDESAISEYRDAVEDDGAKRAFDVFIEWARSSRVLECFPKQQGYLRSFRYFRGSAWEFAFIPNSKWVLFYFRRPAMKSGHFRASEILRWFPEAKELKGGDVSLRIRDPEMAREVVNYASS